MLTSLITIDKPRYTQRLLSLSLASIFVTMSAQAITPEQYQEQRTETLKQQQLTTPNVTIDITPFEVPLPQSATAVNQNLLSSVLI